MSDVTALILAAGMGIRMGPRGKLTPKGLITVGDAPLVPQSVETLRNWGVDKVVIVTGHLAEQYEQTFNGADVQLVHNDDFSNSGSLRSLVVGMPHVSGDLLIVESDLIYAPQALDPIDHSANCFVTSEFTGAGDEVWVWTKENNALDVISKDAKAVSEPPIGEMVGLTYITSDSLAALKQATKTVLERDPAEHYEAAIVELAKTVQITCALVKGLAWTEIDDETMLARAEAEVLPKVIQARAAAKSG